MKPQMKITGVKELRLELRNIAERVPDTARKTMHRSAAVIVEEAKLNTPEDDQLLVNSIRILKDHAGMRGRLQIDIVAGGDTVINPDGRPINLDQYALLVHENYETAVAYVNGPGERTRRKMAAHPGRYIGRGFLTRAAEDEEPKLERKMITAVQAEITRSLK